MVRYLSWIPTVLLLAGFSCPASALRLVVPDDAPTIQAALDAGADVVAVRDGLAPERLRLPARGVVLEPVPLFPSDILALWDSMPRIQSMDLPYDNQYFDRLTLDVRGFRFLGPVNICAARSGNVVFEGCRFDSSLVVGCDWFTVYRVRGCLFLGNVNLRGYVQFLSNTVIGATLIVRADGYSDIRHNFFQGSPGAAMELNLTDGGGPVAWNTIRRAHDGIRFALGDGGARVFGNDIADCSGDGIIYPCGWGAQLVHCDSNRIERCGGAGIAVRGECDPHYTSIAHMSGNVIQQTGAGGIDLGPGSAARLLRNTVLDAGGNGITLASADSLMDNIVGRSGGAGIRITSWGLPTIFGPPRLTGNTVFGSAGPGIHLSGSGEASGLVANNIATLNGASGLKFDGSLPPQLSCNDWFLNRPAGTVGITPGPTDVSLDPQFCDLGAADVHLAASSPLLAVPGCGLVGALGQGCGAVVGVDEATVDGPESFRAWPVPASGGVAFEVPPSPGSTLLEVFDVSGARRWQATIPAGATRLEWDRRESGGRVAAPGVYFARLRREGREVARARVVLAE